jgi:hypothetical protein
VTAPRTGRTRVGTRLALLLGLAAAGACLAVSWGSPVQVDGHVSGLAPGTSETLMVLLTNHRRIAVEFDDPAVRVDVCQAGSVQGVCDPGHLLVEPVPSPIRIPGGDTAFIDLEVRLSVDAPDVCQGALFHVFVDGRPRPAWGS